MLNIMIFFASFSINFNWQKYFQCTYTKNKDGEKLIGLSALLFILWSLDKNEDTQVPQVHEENFCESRKKRKHNRWFFSFRPTLASNRENNLSYS